MVLSACDSARGKSAPGEGVLGLVSGLQIAGARAVVASLWRVDDLATRLLMERFHAELRKGSPAPRPAAALQEAAQWLRSAKPGGRDDSAARYWAAFVAYERR